MGGKRQALYSKRRFRYWRQADNGFDKEFEINKLGMVLERIYFPDIP